MVVHQKKKMRMRMSTMCIDVLIDATVDDFLTIASAGSICDQRNV